jgi:predicted nucleic acid-binding Zn ribbon protein
MPAKSRRDKIREQILREWRGIDEPLDLNGGIHRPGENIDAILRRFGIQEGLDEEQVKATWRELAGDFIATHSAPDSVKDGQLVLRVTQPAMRFHLEQMKPMLLERLRGRFGPDRIRTIRFVLG